MRESFRGDDFTLGKFATKKLLDYPLKMGDFYKSYLNIVIKNW